MSPDAEIVRPVAKIVAEPASPVAVPALPVTSPVTSPSKFATMVPTHTDTTSELRVASGIKVNLAAESSNPRNACLADPE